MMGVSRHNFKSFHARVIVGRWQVWAQKGKTWLTKIKYGLGSKDGFMTGDPFSGSTCLEKVYVYHSKLLKFSFSGSCSPLDVVVEFYWG